MKHGHPYDWCRSSEAASAETRVHGKSSADWQATWWLRSPQGKVKMRGEARERERGNEWSIAKLRQVSIAPGTS